MGRTVIAVLAISFLFLHFGYAQKVIQKILVNPESRAFQIDVGNCYELKLSTSNNDEVVVVATIDGEYQKDLVVRVEEDGKNVLISTGFQPNFVNPNDKLSAHKEVSIALDIILPRDTTANVFGIHANVMVKGQYKKLKVNLYDGDCRLQRVGETVFVKTQKGTIFLLADSGVVNAQSSYGSVYDEGIPLGEPSYDLRSVEGDIRITRTK